MNRSIKSLSHVAHSALNNVQGTGRNAKQLLAMFVDGVCMVFGFWLALGIRYSDLQPDLTPYLWTLTVVCVGSLAIYAALGIYRAVVRFSGQRLQLQLYKGAILSSLLVVLADYLLANGALPRSIFVVYGLVLLVSTSASRGVWRAMIGHAVGRQGERVAIYGAGQAGRQLLEVLRLSDPYVPVCFIDGNTALNGVEIDGLRVISPGAVARECLPENQDFRRVLLALPSASPAARQQMVSDLAQAGLAVKTMPGLDELLMGSSISVLRDVSPDDVLGRSAVAPRQDLMSECVKGKRVLVTGAGGSIGSEISRQLLKLAPTHLFLLDSSEPSLYAIEQELSGATLKEQLAFAGTEAHFVLGSVLDNELMRKIMIDEKIDLVYHAAAYKHVPLVEANPASGAQVNVLGTLGVLNAALGADVERFVMVSTDKAVRPTNVMGATKRMAELLVQHKATKPGKCKFCMVRFGNVLGSSGSVVPKFLRQIDQGGPLTVTHPNVTRYFMTIPEASQLVIQAGAMANGGEVYVLDMGEPRRIVDLAKQLITLRGLSVRDENNPEGDIEIAYSGLRPGEKLFEELLIDGDNVEPTDHPKISRAREGRLSPDSIRLSVEQFRRACEERNNEAVVALLRTYVEEYAPAPSPQGAASTNP